MATMLQAAAGDYGTQEGVIASPVFAGREVRLQFQRSSSSIALMSCFAKGRSAAGVIGWPARYELGLLAADSGI